MSDSQFSPEVVALHERLNREAEAGGYHLNPDRNLTLGLVAGLLKNERRYGYPMCPCRLAFGEKDEGPGHDLSLRLPRPDVVEFGACYCGLYVSKTLMDGQDPAPGRARTPPERVCPPGLPACDPRGRRSPVKTGLPVWRCRVCGYLCARENPPEVCPVCKARKDRFEPFVWSL